MKTLRNLVASLSALVLLSGVLPAQQIIDLQVNDTTGAIRERGNLTAAIFKSGNSIVTGPASAVDERIAVYDSTTGKLLKDGGSTIADITAAVGDVDGPASATDEAVVVFDGTTGKLVKNSAVTIATATGDLTLTTGDIELEAGAINIARSSTGLNALQSEVDGDLASRFIINANGYHIWGSGSGGQDTSLYRSGAGVLETAGDFTVLGEALITQALTTNGNISTLRGGTAQTTIESSVNGAVAEFIAKGLNSTGTARQVNMGINKFANDVFSIYDGTTERFRLGITDGNITTFGDVRPTTSDTYDLGSASLPWRTGYFDDLHGKDDVLTVVDPLVASSTITAGGAITSTGSLIDLNSPNNAQLYLDRSGTSASAIRFRTDGSNEWFVGTGVSGGDTSMTFYSHSLGANVLQMTAAGAVTFGPDDNLATAFEVAQGTNQYIEVATTNGSETVTIGNNTTNPVAIIPSSKAATNTTSGALQVPNGGISTGGDIYAGGELSVIGNFGGANQRVAKFSNTGGNSYIELGGTTSFAQLWGASNGEFQVYTGGTSGTLGTKSLSLFPSGDATFTGNINLATTKQIAGSSTANSAEEWGVFSNTGTGTAAEASLVVSNGGSSATGLSMGATGTAFTTAGGYIQDSGYLATGTGLAGGFSVISRAGDLRLYSGGHTNLAATFDATTQGLTMQSVNNAINLTGGDDTTDLNSKEWRQGVNHRTNAEEPAAVIYARSTPSDNGISIGGGTGTMNAATLIEFFTAADTTTTTGTRAAGFNSAGDLDLDSTTASTSSTTGSLTTAGGLGVVGDAWVGDVFNVSAPEVTIGQVRIRSDGNDRGISIEEFSGGESWQIGVNATGDLEFEDSGSTVRATFADGTGDLDLTSTTASTSISTGSLTTAGGLGVVGDIYSGNAILSTAPTAGIGYDTGAGGAVIQITSRTTGVTINRVAGVVTMFTAAGTTTWQTFTVTNSAVEVNDVIILSQRTGSDLIMTHVTKVANGSFNISFATTGGTTSDAAAINFAVIKGTSA